MRFMKKTKLAVLICTAIVSSALISCAKEENTNGGITWKQSVTLSGGDYGTSGPTSGGNATTGTVIPPKNNSI